MPFDRDKIQQQVAKLANSGVFIGTSSWKYPGWAGMLYEEQRYLRRGKLSESLLEENCLSEYAQVFKTVGVDFTYYKFPGEQVLRELAAQVPADFQFGFKITGEITIKRFTQRAGVRAGQTNPNFLNADLFANAFLKPCEVLRKNVGVLMFEFSRFFPSDYKHGSEFIADVDRFLEALPRGWPYAIELRNDQWLQPEYFACLARHGVSHVFNNWQAMPSVSKQMALMGSRTNPQLTTARFLLKPGRGYQEAKDTFKPYDHLQEVNEEARAAGRKLIAEGKSAKKDKKTLIYVNNRLEGNALETISAMLDAPDT